MHTSQLLPGELSSRASISPDPLSPEDALSREIAEIEEGKTQRDEAERKMKVTRAKEIERGRRRVILGNPEDEVFHEPDALPVYESTPRMLITGMRAACQEVYYV
ncbi:MAG: hypothetical protein CL912_03725 [Deltaproteobacteria bacterium]|nr:hypothetical protein [Deltaproteobacteria bacterium]